MARFRTKPLTREEEVAAAVTSVAVGTGVAAVVWYVARILLSREEMESKKLVGGSRRALPKGNASDATAEA